MSQILHVVVGAGLKHYFRNALQSVLEETPDDVFVIYNAISRKDTVDIGGLENSFPNRIVGFHLRDNTGDEKVGGLYAAYNLALDFAQDKYDYVSFIQGDMQMMQWPHDAVQKLKVIFEPQSNSTKVFSVTTALDCFGKFYNAPVNTGKSEGPNEILPAGKAPALGAVADVAVYWMDRVASENFRFSGTEEALSKQMAKRGYSQGKLDGVLLAFVPWPAVVRKSEVMGDEFSPPEGERILKLSSANDRIPGTVTNSGYQENYVVPNGYRTLFPYWPTGVENKKWVLRRWRVTQALGISFFSAIDSEGNLSHYLS